VALKAVAGSTKAAVVESTKVVVGSMKAVVESMKAVVGLMKDVAGSVKAVAEVGSIASIVAPRARDGDDSARASTAATCFSKRSLRLAAH
jgi:hypothetical protein